MASNLPAHIPAICYEIFVRSFCDSNGDGIGDLNGITSKLDYLADLGVEAIWLTPIHPSPSYHKYDVTDFYDIDPEFGTLDDFRNLLAEAHKRNIAVYLDLIVNHTSTQHPWFVEASKGPDNPFREFYWWMTPEKIEALGIGKRETSADTDEVYPWHDNPGDPEQYYGIFFSGMPDLNYDSEKLRIELSFIIHHWLIDIGVDGFRLDAARHIYPAWMEYNNQLFWWFFDYFVRNIKADAYTVGEIWAKGDEVAPYFKNLNSAFHFDISFIIQRILVNEKDEGLIRKLKENYALFVQFNPNFIDALMLTNHDQSRIASVVGNNIRKVKQAASILLTLPGLPYLYYGEEIGMLGPKPDVSIREPFLWSDDTAGKDTPHWQTAKFSTLDNIKPLSQQQTEPGSVFNHYKKLIALRKSEPALGQILQPNIEPVVMVDDGLLAYLRPHADSPVLVIHNLTGTVRKVKLPDVGIHFNHILFPRTEALSTEQTEIQMVEHESIILTYSPAIH